MKNIKQQIIDRGLESKAKIILPEVNDDRVKKATRKLLSMGYDIVDINDYNNIVDRVLVDLGLYHRSNCKVGTWMQVYTTGQNMRIHDHYGGGELVSFVHFVQPIDSKVFYFYDSNNNKIYPDEQKKNDFIVFPPWLQHGVDNNKTTDKRAIISGNVMLNMMYKNQNMNYTKINYTKRVEGGESLFIDSEIQVAATDEHLYSSTFVGAGLNLNNNTELRRLKKFAIKKARK